jgi:Co/Zn/Cd efflux system component
MTEKNTFYLLNMKYKKALTKVFIIHIIMFCIAFTAAVIAKSSSVLADSLDFIGDAISYALSIYVLSRGVLVGAIISIAKAVTMLSFGVPVMFYAVTRFEDGVVPSYEIMNIAGFLGIIAHIVCIYLLYKFKTGDSNRLSVWICTINDLLSNIITVIASQIVRVTDSVIPDIVAAMIIISIAVYGAIVILKQAIKEIKQHKAREIYVD